MTRNSFKNIAQSLLSTSSLPTAGPQTFQNIAQAFDTGSAVRSQKLSQRGQFERKEFGSNPYHIDLMMKSNNPLYQQLAMEYVVEREKQPQKTDISSAEKDLKTLQNSLLDLNKGRAKEVLGTILGKLSNDKLGKKLKESGIAEVKDVADSRPQFKPKDEFVKALKELKNSEPNSAGHRFKNPTIDGKRYKFALYADGSLRWRPYDSDISAYQDITSDNFPDEFKTAVVEKVDIDEDNYAKARKVLRRLIREQRQEIKKMKEGDKSSNKEQRAKLKKIEEKIRTQVPGISELEKMLGVGSGGSRGGRGTSESFKIWKEKKDDYYKKQTNAVENVGKRFGTEPVSGLDGQSPGDFTNSTLNALISKIPNTGKAIDDMVDVANWLLEPLFNKLNDTEVKKFTENYARNIDAQILDASNKYLEAKELGDKDQELLAKSRLAKITAEFYKFEMNPQDVYREVQREKLNNKIKNKRFTEQGTRERAWDVVDDDFNTIFNAVLRAETDPKNANRTIDDASFKMDRKKRRKIRQELGNWGKLDTMQSLLDWLPGVNFDYDVRRSLLYKDLTKGDLALTAPITAKPSDVKKYYANPYMRSKLSEEEKNWIDIARIITGEAILDYRLIKKAEKTQRKKNREQKAEESKKE